MSTYTAFANDLWLATGSREHIVETLRVMPDMARASDLLVFDDRTGKQIDFDLRELTAPASPPQSGRGRPKMGVVSREVTLLPRHWDWLGSQQGGASAALRRLIEQAMRQGPDNRAGRDAAFQFLTAIAGHREYFEEAIRAIYRDEPEQFETLTASWPPAIRQHAASLAWNVTPEPAALRS
ncbi:MAG: hypothetical protein RL299_87 [Pseudomonadota bacterium]|jgi:hypothetical protein